jgi:glycerate-2-kinase
MMSRQHAQRIWQAGVDAVRPGPLLAAAVAEYADVLRGVPRIVVLGAGKAGAAMAVALEDALDSYSPGLARGDASHPLDTASTSGDASPRASPGLYDGWINVPAGT